MSELVRAKITRAGVANPIAQNIMIQIDKEEAPEATTFQGADPHFTYRAQTVMLPMNNPMLVLFRDYVIDLDFIDPLTNMNRRFLIVSDPEMHTLDGHWEWLCERVRGT